MKVDSVSFDLEFLYSQITVYDAELLECFNDWHYQHVSQGFSWRPGSVSFATLEDGGTLRVMVVLGNRTEVSAQSVDRAVLVPFGVSGNSGVTIASTLARFNYDMPPGSYALLYETGMPGTGKMWARLTFAPSASVEPRVITADPQLNPSYPLLMAAIPAI